MFRRVVRRSATLAAMAALIASGVAMADVVGADGDDVAGVQSFVDLGTVAPGATITRDVDMVLTCTGLRHVDPGQVVNLWQSEVTGPALGGSINATATSVGPVPTGWANDAAGIVGCASPLQVTSAEPSHVTIVAPTVPGLDYELTVTYGRTLSPAGVADAASMGGLTVITFRLDVEDLDSTPPTLFGMPAAMDLVTDDPTGTTLDYALPTATDDQDPAPTVACDPAPGTHIPTGVTTMTCAASDASGNSTVATFDVVLHLGSVEWGDPVGAAAELRVSLGRSIPLKVRAWLDGLPQAGPAAFEVWSCTARSTGSLQTAAAGWNADAARWMAVLDTSGLAAGCHTVALVRDGTSLGSFVLEIVDPPAAGATPGRGSSRGD
ncbi:MAG: HYR domain-containing protein [Chloroflexota bacterium]|nr:MAG: HYR domain-containing protein [Chloroflexota bacterium]